MSIVLSTYGIIFIGTPHQGLEDPTALISSGSPCSSLNRDLHDFLLCDGPQIQDQLANFSIISSHFDIKFIYETRASPAPTCSFLRFWRTRQRHYKVGPTLFQCSLTPVHAHQYRPVSSSFHGVQQFYLPPRVRNVLHFTDVTKT